MTFAEEMKFEGRAERSKEVAMNALKQGLPLQLVSQITGLSLERIAQLKQEHVL